MEIAGGATSGYCATGMVANDSNPINAIPSATTQAKIGRSIKKCGICKTQLADRGGNQMMAADLFMLCFVLQRLLLLQALWLVVLPGGGCNRDTRTNVLKPCNNNLGTGWQSVIHNPHTVKALANSDRHHLRLTLVINNINRSRSTCAILHCLLGY